ncbi:MAG: DUF368 domain-containing protein [Phycisphaerae bacterium]|nr:DUF368 domain-containing protein [Phycisphaerae bacterium]
MTRIDTIPAEALPSPLKPVPILRTSIAGVLMGLANLVPGISGGTMIVVMGLYDTFIDSVADAARLRFTRRSLLFLGLLVMVVALTIVLLSGAVVRLVTLHQSAMYALFIGLTLGGAPQLTGMIGGKPASAIAGVVVGFGLMVLIATTGPESVDRAAIKEAVAAGTLVVQPSYARDFFAGVLGMSAMVLPGVSGAYMLLVLGRYETILASISLAKSWVLSAGREGDVAAIFGVIIPTAIGAALSLVGFSNLLKWLLHRHRRPTLGVLLGILLGSVVGIWPFDATSTGADFATGAGLAVVGFLTTLGLSRISA